MTAFLSLFQSLTAAWARCRSRSDLTRQIACGDLIVDPPPEIRLLMELPGDFIPDDARELARDLFGLLLFLDLASRAGRHDIATRNSFALLGRIRSAAWQGTFETEALTDHIRTLHPRSDVARRFVQYCDELAKKRSTYLFLPIVAQIDRHQAKAAALDDDLYRMLDESTERQDDGAHAALAVASFALVPDAKERAAFAFASMLTGAQSLAGAYKDHLEAIADQLRRIAKAKPGDALDSVSDDSASVIDWISIHAPWIWLEALVIVENWIARPQFFEHAFEVETTRASI